MLEVFGLSWPPITMVERQLKDAMGEQEASIVILTQDSSVKTGFSQYITAVGHKPVTGAATTLNCAVNPDLNSQEHFYYGSCRPKQPSIESR